MKFTFTTCGLIISYVYDRLSNGVETSAIYKPHLQSLFRLVVFFISSLLLIHKYGRKF